MREVKKKKFSKKHRAYLAVAIIFIIAAIIIIPSGNQNKVLIKTSMGDIVVKLNEEAAPLTVANFKAYVEESYYDGLVFHRVIPGFMVQGGGFEQTGVQKPTKDPIILESNNGLTNDKYTIAMARGPAKNSATSQFFINSNDNAFLNYAPGNGGYAVFGKVISGQEVIDAIEKVPTTTKYGIMENWPVNDVTIESIKLI
ncbi:MAG: peptidylprolyl isomerase [Nanoarchaeota archaeon]|jgi:cyclophilin family peptidyl-prolyl cis-trans isomerase|nr:peptidylprolyl isomerase [Nanoarchaeota archaeon]